LARGGDRGGEEGKRKKRGKGRKGISLPFIYVQGPEIPSIKEGGREKEKEKKKKKKKKETSSALIFKPASGILG